MTARLERPLLNELEPTIEAKGDVEVPGVNDELAGLVAVGRPTLVNHDLVVSRQKGADGNEG